MTGHWWWLLLLTGCSGTAVPAADRPQSAAAEGDAEFTLTQKSSSQPNRGQANTAAPSTLTVDQSCSAESCEGVLPSEAISELKKTAAAASDCYERELKENVELEGKLTMLLRVLDRASPERGPCNVTVESSTFKLPAAFESCLVEVLKKTAARSKQGCVDVALPLSFVRQEVEVPAAAGAGGVGNGVGGGAATAAGGKTSR
jgi:hypothetical protein